MQIPRTSRSPAVTFSRFEGTAGGDPEVEDGLAAFDGREHESDCLCRAGPAGGPGFGVERSALVPFRSVTVIRRFNGQGMPAPASRYDRPARDHLCSNEGRVPETETTGEIVVMWSWRAPLPVDLCQGAIRMGNG
ncbi:MAG: hypothetical protein GXY82_07830 [Methanospirillum sp.]|nr:hypothetical protein [Methanospirillum sp.]